MTTFSAIAFESCSDEVPWTGNVLLSPSTSLAADTLLTFQLGMQRRSSLDVYVTSDVGHISARIAEFGASGTNSSYEPFSSESVCVPRTGAEIAFVASAKYAGKRFVRLQPNVVIKDVVLSGTSCTPSTVPGNEPAVFLHDAIPYVSRTSAKLTFYYLHA